MSRYFSLSQLQPYTPGEQPRSRDYIKLNTNENPYPPAPAVRNLLNPSAVADLRLYSDPTCRGLKEKLAGLYGLTPEQIFVANGSDDILNFVFWGFPGEKGAVFPDITYGFYKVFAQLHRVPYREIPLKEDFSLNPRDYYHQKSLIVIANPNAPTGLALTPGEIQGILDTNQDSLVVIDEAYVDFGAESCYPLLSQYENLLVVRTFSKSRCLAGGRLGYALGNPSVIADLERLKFSTNPYALNRLTLALGEATVAEEAYYQEISRKIQKTRENTEKSLKALGFLVIPSLGNFLFARRPGISGENLYQSLKEKAILVRHFPQERIGEYVRITIGTDEQMEKLTAALEEICHENSPD